MVHSFWCRRLGFAGYDNPLSWGGSKWIFRRHGRHDDVRTRNVWDNVDQMETTLHYDSFMDSPNARNAPSRAGGYETEARSFMIRFSRVRQRMLTPALVVSLGCLIGVLMWAERPRGPLECRVKCSDFERAVRLARASSPGQVSEFRIVRDVFVEMQDGRLSRSTIQNPLLMGDAFARLEFRNNTGAPILVIADDAYHPEPAVVYSGQLGAVFSRAWDTAGNPVELYRAGKWYPMSGLKHIGLVLPERPPPPPPVVELPIGTFIQCGFGPLGFVKPHTDLRPGRYTVQAVFQYTEASTGTKKEVASDPLTIRVTQDDIDQWHKWWKGRDPF
jgi:hypothetical protein